MVEKGLSVQGGKLQDLWRPRLGKCTKTLLPNSIIKGNYKSGLNSRNEEIDSTSEWKELKKCVVIFIVYHSEIPIASTMNIISPTSVFCR